MLQVTHCGKAVTMKTCDTCNTEDEDTKGGHTQAVLKSKILIFSQRQAAVPNRKAQSVKQCTGAHIQRIQRVI